MDSTNEFGQIPWDAHMSGEPAPFSASTSETSLAAVAFELHTANLIALAAHYKKLGGYGDKEVQALLREARERLDLPRNGGGA